MAGIDQMELSSIVKLEDATRYLAEIKSVDEVKSIRDKAEAMRVYAKQARLGLESQNYAAEIKLRAERRAGELLREMAENGQRVKPVDTLLSSRDTTTAKLTLPDLQITSNQSANWQRIATVPAERFEAHIAQTKAAGDELTTASVLRVAQADAGREAKRAREAARTAIPEQLSGESYNLITGDFRQQPIADNSIDVIITDPPYALTMDNIMLYQALGELAEYALKPGGSLLVMTATRHFYDFKTAIGNAMLRFQWTLCYLTPGGQSPQIFDRRINTFWKPVLWFVKGDYTGNWQGDVIKSERNEKDAHHWQQSESGMMELVKRFSLPDELILDPFCGSGTTGVAAIRQHRRFMGIDCDPAAISSAAERLANG